MARMGRVPLPIPSGVQVRIEGSTLQVEGPKGKLARRLPAGLKVVLEGGKVRVQLEGEGRRLNALHGLYRTLVGNMILGVSKGFQRGLEVFGVGYRAEVAQGGLNLTLGFSHPIVFPLPQGVRASVEKQVRILLEGPDKELVGQTAAKLRALRPPDPYKGKGVRYADEVLRRKVGKAATTTAGASGG